MKKPDWKPQNPWFYGAFPVCRNYTVRALLRQLAFGKWCSDEDDSGVAGTQWFLYHREYLFAFGLRFQGFFSRSNAERAWNGFKSGKWHLKSVISLQNRAFSLLLWNCQAQKFCFLHKKAVQSVQKARCTVDWRSIRDLNSGGATNALSHFECDPFDLLGNAPYSNPPKSSPEKGEKSRREQQIFNCRKWCVFDDESLENQR